MNGVKSHGNRKCYTCNKTFSKAEHLTRHIRGHTKERPYPCGVCGKVYSRSDVLRRHEKSHQNLLPQSTTSVPENFPPDHEVILTPSSNEGQSHPIAVTDPSLLLSSPSAPTPGMGELPNAQPVRMNLHDSVLNADSSSWFLGADFDVDALDFSLSSAISEWAQLPTAPLLAPNAQDELRGLIPAQSLIVDLDPSSTPADVVRKKWYTYLSPSEEHRSLRPTSAGQGPGGPEKLDADETYRAGLSQRLQPRMHDEALPSSEQLNLFAKLFFSRFHSLFPVVHAPSFRPTTENSLLFLSVCSVGSLFVGSAHAVAQGTRIFERLNKAILASWESILSRSRPDALSMIQAAIMGQTFGILSGRPKDLLLADVLHGTVIAWAREAFKRSPISRNQSIQFSRDADDHEIEEAWHQWIEIEQRGRVELALNIHDAELASITHHEPIRKHRFYQYPHLASDALFMAPTAAKWAAIYRQSSDPSASSVALAHPTPDDRFQNAGGNSNFAAYSILESINAYLLEARWSNTFDEHVAQNISDLLIHWWRKYSPQLHNEEQDPFSLMVLWHSIYMSLYADLNLLEQGIGRNGQTAANEACYTIREWAGTLEASKSLVHALLIQRYLERMRVSSEPAIHVPRALFSAALTWLCFTRIGCKQAISMQAFESPEIQLLGRETAVQEAQGQAFGDSAFADVNHLHRLIDLLHRVGRWAISKSFAFVLFVALEEGEDG